MKTKYLVLVLVVGVVIPNLVFAAWWNPLSWFNNWGFLRSSDTKTEMLENRVKELEKKLETASTTSNIEKTESNSIKTEVKVIDTTTTKKELPKQNTYNGSVLVVPLYTSVGKILDSQIGLIDLVLNDSSRYIDGIIVTGKQIGRAHV